MLSFESSAVLVLVLTRGGLLPEDIYAANALRRTSGRSSSPRTKLRMKRSPRPRRNSINSASANPFPFPRCTAERLELARESRKCCRNRKMSSVRKSGLSSSAGRAAERRQVVNVNAILGEERCVVSPIPARRATAWTPNSRATGIRSSSLTPPASSAAKRRWTSWNSTVPRAPESNRGVDVVCPRARRRGWHTRRRQAHRPDIIELKKGLLIAVNKMT